MTGEGEGGEGEGEAEEGEGKGEGEGGEDDRNIHQQGSFISFMGHL